MRRDPLPDVYPAPAATTPGSFRVVLVSPYELGRQPFALAHAAAWLKRAGMAVDCLDLSLQKLDPNVLAGAQVVAFYLGMYTATRIAMEALPRARALAPQAAFAAFGLYAPVNESLLRALGVAAVFGGESEPDLLAWAQTLRAGHVAPRPTRVHTGRIEFLLPDRSGLPPLARYAHLVLPDGGRRTVGFVETTRGCKHLCRHCPVVPVYQGRFRAVPLPVVMADIEQQVAMGAEHISFTDHDFLNGPSHALRVVRAMHARFPSLSFDATIKIEHLIRHAEVLPLLKAAGCAFVISAVESVDDRVLAHLAKNHTRADFVRAVESLRTIGLPLAPTWVAFHPWSTLEGYLDLLKTLVELRLVEAVPPVQLAIRLLVPAGSRLMELPELAQRLGPFDARLLGHPWHHADCRVDRLQQEVERLAAAGEQAGLPRRAIFETIWQAAHRALGRAAPSLAGRDLGAPIPHLSEPWYCCAEPTAKQLQSF
ncbi:CUAEP/CCAEP-tail radical SAM (seleno)protein [Thiobacter aerophilum]|uniref:CUAEP/CCAEP-tail radical SAM protein n=1 Tax=Thiobacter aerophilum TaxID=3121275 RepID=A0ABV0EC26_9BURK